jgi:hypothetical protein
MSNRTLIDMVRSMLCHSSFSSHFLGEAKYLLNFVPTKTHNITPYELWTRRKLNLNSVRVWRSFAHILISSYTRTKLDSKTIKSNFIG